MSLLPRRARFGYAADLSALLLACDLHIMQEESKCWVRVWMEHSDQGPTLIAGYRADRDVAERYQQVMQRNFAGLRVSVDSLPDPPPARDLPAEQLWRLAP